MQLTGKSIVERNILIGVCNDAIQQQGVDLRINRLFKVNGLGLVPTTGKTRIPERTEIFPEFTIFSEEFPVFELEPGYYEVEFLEGCSIPNNAAMILKSRSSLVRCGADVRSGQFDGGFTTERMGCYLEVILPIVIGLHARIAQAIVTETEPVSDKDLYNGQFQNDKQRNN